MENEFNEDEQKTNFFDRIKRYPLEYIGIAFVGAVATFLIIGKPAPSINPFPPSGAPVETLTFDEILEFYHNFDELDETIQRYTRRTTGDSTFIASRAVSFDYQEFIDYLNFIQDNAKEAKIEISQLRFYFGQYKDVKQKNKNYRQTLFFNPTTKFKTGKKRGDLSYAILRSNDSTKAVPLSSVLDSINDKEIGHLKLNQTDIQQEASILSILSVNPMMLYEAQSQARNSGQISPPPSDIE
ncbi:hypothetical protein J8281_10215 [Aquimarina sp. U1-2]|uniref:hypothetical protein n=1 Tax=Aquimarina sp. U1-2 TaxID=2823141 RepID=UPI001AECD1B3|nr:hypothetical protein [Aquimarina sp. U1-2]MBP2832558.1 hypothetical protein [Aquimarina sp. U1-2]